MFVNIVKNGKVMNVTRSAFLNFFANLGWVEANASTPVKAKKEKVEEVSDEIVEPIEEVPEETTEDEWDEAINEEEEEDEEIQKPLSEMSKKELIQLATEKGINTNGMNTNQIREALKKEE